MSSSAVTGQEADQTDAECGLILQQEGEVQQLLVRFINLVLNYRYGLETLVAPGLARAADLAAQYGPRVRCVFVVQQTRVEPDALARALGPIGAAPVFILCPMAASGVNGRAFEGADHVSVCPWERVFGRTDASLLHHVARAFSQHRIPRLLDASGDATYQAVRQRLERRVRHLHTLPSPPEIVLRIMRLVNDPQASAGALEEVLCSDAAIVWKLLQVMKSPALGGGAHQGKWSLGEVVVRLGRRKVGAIAQQIAIINNLVRPEDSDFDRRLFWQHSVGCALVADRLYTRKLIELGQTLEFDQYWIGALLHDIGKLALGYFSWAWFGDVVEQMGRDGISFREAEAGLGDAANHEDVGRLLVVDADMGPELAEAAGSHHGRGDELSPLVCLVHVANNLCNEMGLSYPPGDPPAYSDTVMRALNVQPNDLEQVRLALGDEPAVEVAELVDRCLQ